ncbi:HNH endonuclease [Salmonella enterica]
MGKYKEIDYNEMNDNVYYDETSPSFLRWKVTRDNIQAGTIAGSINSSGYYRITINNVSYRVHRIIWVLFHGEIDSNLTVDHLDRNRANNNIRNLRLVTHSQNCSNKENSERANGLPRNISYHSNKRVDSNGRYYMTAMIRIPDSNKRISKSGYDLDELLLWLETKKAEFGIVN